MANSNISTEPIGPILTKVCVELSGTEGRKICSNDPDHMTNMAAMPVDSKKLYKSSSLEPID